MAANISRKRKHSDGARARSFPFLAEVADGSARPHRLTPMQDEATDSESDGNARQQYQNISVNGRAKVHMGDVYVETVNYYTHHRLPPQISDSPQGLRCKAFMQSLCYQRMENGIAGIETSYDVPDDWLLKRPNDLEWVVSSAQGSQPRSLWIRGRPGSGKSVLLKRLLSVATRRMRGYVVLPFFFSKSEGSLESSAEGMYRAVLHQLLEKIPRLRSLLHFPPTPMKSRFLAVDILKHLIREAVLQLRGECLVFIIDGLDECDVEGARDVVRFFAGLSTLTRAWNVSFHTCFSSRRYPDNIAQVLGRSGSGVTSLPEDDWEDIDGSSRSVSTGTHQAGPKNTELWNPRECLWVQALAQILHDSRDPQSTLLQLGAFNRTLDWNHPVILSERVCEARSQQLSLPVIYCGFLRETSIICDLLSAMHSRRGVSTLSEDTDGK